MSPLRVHDAADSFVVDRPDRRHVGRRKRRQAGRSGILTRLSDVARTRNRAGYAFFHQHPPQCPLCHRRVGWDQRSKPLDGIESDGERHARERLSLVELFAVSVELPVIVGGER